MRMVIAECFVDIHLGSPRDALFRKITSIINIKERKTQFVNCMINDEEFDAVVYRMHRSPRHEHIVRIQSDFDKRVGALAASA